MMINYSAVYSRIDQFLQTREGLRNPKNAQDYPWFIRELTGIFCGAAHENDLFTQDILHFLDLVEDHKLNHVLDDGKVHDMEYLISESIVKHPLYYITEFTLMNYKPGRAQIGPGEFFLCFYDCDSTFGIDNQAGYDVVIDDTPTELKGIGSNFTSDELFDKYAESDKVERLMIVLPVSNAKKPKQRTRYACVTFDKMNWREAFYHRGGTSGGLSIIKDVK